MAGAGANALALLAFCRGPGLRTLSNRFVMNLLVVNLAACATLLPLLLLDSTLPGSSLILCSISEGVSAGYCTASILGVLLIAVDQYYAVVDPLRYHSHVGAVRCAGMLAAAWLSALLAGVLGALEPRGAGLWAACSEPHVQNPISLYRRVYAGVFAVVVFVIPFAALCWIYISIYGAAHRNSQRTRRNGSGSVVASTPPPELSCAECRSLPSGPSLLSARACLPVSRSAPSMEVVAAEAGLVPSRRSSLTSTSGDVPLPPPPPPPQQLAPPLSDVLLGPPPRMERRRSSCPHVSSPSPSPSPSRSASAWLVSSLRCRISNASLFRYREEGRAARVSAIVVVMALGCWAPYVAVLVLHAAVPPASTAPRHLDALALAGLAAAVCISPCLFAFRNRRVQKEVRRMLYPARRKCSLDRVRGRGAGAKGRLAVGGGGSARRLLPHAHTAINFMTSLAEDCSNTPSDSTICNKAVAAAHATGAGGEAMSLGVPLPLPLLWNPHLLPEDALAVDTARSSFSSGASSSQGSALSTDTADE